MCRCWEQFLPAAGLCALQKHRDATHKTFDYVLVAHKVDTDNNLKAQRQRAFIQQLEKKNITVTKLVHDDKVFFGLRAPSQMFDDYLVSAQGFDRSISSSSDLSSIHRRVTCFVEKVALYYLWLAIGIPSCWFQLLLWVL
ncbi:anoctamin-9-like protein [Lates japonicus]|uniref:Anoctamin-9-like protein n=1 Tax=Lates japonicus TaxID=270547 RepID=A0AAD3MRQ2_LATJO|nr:anoctamin-9-like protein [Lates japonicus]